MSSGFQYNLTFEGMDRLKHFYRPRKENMPLFNPGDTFYTALYQPLVYGAVDMKGRVDAVRNDSWEIKHSPVYNYSVSFSDGTFESYLSEGMMAFEDEVDKFH